MASEGGIYANYSSFGIVCSGVSVIPAHSWFENFTLSNQI